MLLCILVRRNYGRKLQVGIKCYDLHSFKGVILLWQSILEIRQIFRVQLIFWSAVVKIYLFATLCWVRKNENSPTNFPSPYDNIFLIVTENKCIVWNYHFWGPACIYLIEFSNINFRIRWKICLRLTLEVQEVVLVSLWLWIYLTRCSNVFLLTLKM